MRKLGIVVGALGAVLLLLVVAVWLLANPNRHREYIQAQLEAQLGRKVTLGDMSLGLLPLRFQVKDPVIADDAAIGQQTPFIKAENLDIQVRLLPLMRGNVQVDSIELRRPNVELIRTKQGTWNFATLGSEAGSRPADSRPADQNTRREFSLEQLRIVDGQIGITDLQHNQPRASYDHIDLTVLHFTKGQPFMFDLAARTANGTLSAQGEVKAQPEMLSANGQLKLEAAQFNDVKIGYPITLDYKAGARLADGVVTIENATLHLGPTSLTLEGSLNTSSSPPVIDVHIKSGDASITELARLASAFGVAFAPGTSVSGRVRADVLAKGTTARPQLTGTVTGNDLKISGQGIPQPVQVKAIELKLTPASIRSSEFTATSGKTTVLGQFELLQYASSSPAIDLGLRAPGATLPEIQSLATAYGMNGLNQLSGDGSLNFDLRAKGSLQSLSKAAAMKALNGVINLDFSPLKIAGFDTAHELGKLGGFASSLGDKNQTDIIRMLGRINVKDGIAQTDDLRVQLAAGNIAANGTADLAAETLNMKLSAVFTKEFSEKTASSRTVGALSTVLTNGNGEVVLPALVTGTFQHPKFAPDLRAVAELQKQKYLPSLNNPAAAVGNILDALKGKPKTDAQQAQPAEGEKPSVVKGILGVLGGQKKQSDKK